MLQSPNNVLTNGFQISKRETIWTPLCYNMCFCFVGNFGGYCLYSPIVKPNYGQHYMQLH